MSWTAVGRNGFKLWLAGSFIQGSAAQESQDKETIQNLLKDHPFPPETATNTKVPQLGELAAIF